MEKPYLLIEVVERHISQPTFFETHKDATEEMVCRFLKALDIKIPDPSYEKAVKALTEEGYLEEDCYLSEYSAACETHGENYDWEIFDLNEEA